MYPECCEHFNDTQNELREEIRFGPSSGKGTSSELFFEGNLEDLKKKYGVPEFLKELKEIRKREEQEYIERAGGNEDKGFSLWFDEMSESAKKRVPEWLKNARRNV